MGTASNERASSGFPRTRGRAGGNGSKRLILVRARGEALIFSMRAGSVSFSAFNCEHYLSVGATVALRVA